MVASLSMAYTHFMLDTPAMNTGVDKWEKVVQDLNGGVRFVNVPRATVTPTTAGPARPTARRRPHGTRPDGDYGDVRVSTGGRYSRLEREWFCLRLSASLLTKED
jgi:hypothetical protein